MHLPNIIFVIAASILFAPFIHAQDDSENNYSTTILEINSSDDFAKFLSRVHEGETFAGQIVNLNKDVSFPVGAKTNNGTFEGLLEGNGHKITDVTTFFFRNNNGEIRDLHIASGNLSVSGTFCSNNSGIIANCVNSANISISYAAEEGIRAAGICSYNSGKIVNCVNEGRITLELVAVYGNWSKAVTTCGGICAISSNGSSIVHCTNTGAISNKGIYSSVTGGIVGNADHATIIGCDNKGSVNSYLLNSSPSNGSVTQPAYQLQHAGGIGGHILYCLLNRCRNYGKVQSNYQYLGGIAGYVGNSDAYNLENFGDIEGYEGYGFHSVSGIIPYFKNPYKRQPFINCINHGKISSFAKYGVATAAGISAEIENAYIANCYSSGSVSSTNIGNLSAGFQIPQYECENSEELNSGIDNTADANAFVSTYVSPEKLLGWIDTDAGVVLKSDYFSYPVPKHGACSVYIYPEEPTSRFTLIVAPDDGMSATQCAEAVGSPIYVNGLLPDTRYSYDVISVDKFETLDNGGFSTLKPQITLKPSEIGYDQVTLEQACDASGIDNMECYLRFYNGSKDALQIDVSSSEVFIEDLDEATTYSAEMVYLLNSVEFKSEKISFSTKTITPKYTLLEATPYSLALKCENYEELKPFGPCIYIKTPKYYEPGGFRQEDSHTYPFDDDGIVILDGLLYKYTPNLFTQYVIHHEERLRHVDDIFTTTAWGGEDIIQVSPKAAMVHALFDGMGGRVINGGYSDYYDVARFYYRDATASEEAPESNRKAACIDNNLDYAVTIPMESFLYQYYISLQRSYYTDPKNKSKNGSWQIIDARTPTVDIVEPRFFNFRFENNNFYCSCIEGEETISSKSLQYKVEDTDGLNTLILSSKSGTETLTRTMTSIVPQLSYLFRMSCNTDNGKKYYSPIYRLTNSHFELADDVKDFETDIINPEIENMQVNISSDRIVIKGKADGEIVRIYTPNGLCVYKGTDNSIHIPYKGIYTILIGNRAHKVIL